MAMTLAMAVMLAIAMAMLAVAIAVEMVMAMVIETTLEITRNQLNVVSANQVLLCQTNLVKLATKIPKTSEKKKKKKTSFT